MALKTQCPQCGKSLHVRDEAVGKTVRCPGCRSAFQVDSVEFQDSDTFGEGNEAKSTHVEGGIVPNDAKAVSAIGSLGRFQLREVVGRGGYGIVYRATDPLLDREVALKVVRFGPGEESRARRVMVEAKAAASLRHPNIVPVFEAGTASHVCYIASELVRGESLHELIKKVFASAAGLDYRRRTGWIRDLAEALDYAHGERIIHRDVKPHNILVGEQGRPQLTDFGLAKRIDDDATLTAADTLLGTPAYMSPEQARGRMQDVGPKSDQYSLGATFYELLTGKSPFEGNLAQVITDVINREPPRPRSLNSEIPADLETICLKAMAKEPDHRYPDCAAFAEDLRRWSEDEPILARRAGAVEQAARIARRNPAAALLVGVVIVLTLAGLAAVTALWQQARANYREALRQEQIADQRREELQRTAERERMKTLEAEEARRRAESLARELQSEKERAEENARLAQAKEAQARASEERANASAIEAERERDKAIQEKNRADLAVADARAKHDDLQTQMARERKARYLQSILEAQRAMEDRDARQAETFLADCPAEFRHWEWRYLARRCFQPVPAISFLDHRERVEAVALSSIRDSLQTRSLSLDREWILSGSSDKTIKLWKSRTPAPVWTGEQHRGAVTAVAFGGTPPQWMASASLDRTVGLWRFNSSDSAAPRLEKSFPLEAACLAFSPDGNYLAIGTLERSIAIWNLEKQEELARLVVAETTRGQTDYRLEPQSSRATDQPPVGGNPVALAFSPDGAFLAAGASDGRLYVWSFPSGEVRWGASTSDAHAQVVTAIAFGPDGSRLLSGGADRNVKLWDAGSGRHLAEFRGHTDTIRGVALTPDGRRLFSGSRDETVRVWEVATGETLLTLTAGVREPTLGLNKEIRKFRQKEQRGIDVPIVPGKDKAISSLVISDDGLRVVAGCDDKTIKLWDASYDQELIRMDTQSGSVGCVAFSPDGSRLAAAGGDGRVRVFEAQSGKLIGDVTAHKGPVHAVAFSLDGALLASGDSKGLVLVSNAETPSKSLEVKEADGGAVLCIAFCQDPERPLLAWGNREGLIQVVDTTGQGKIRTLRRHKGAVNSLAFHRRGNLLVSGGLDTRVRLWNLNSDECNEGPPIEGHVITGVGFMPPDGHQVVSAGRDGTLRCWNAGTLIQENQCLYPRVCIRSVAVRPDGKWFAAGCENRMLNMWDGTSGWQPPTDRGHADKILSVAYSPDGTRLASADESGIVKIWDTSED